VKYNPFHLLDWNATILPLLNENFGRLKRLLEKGHASDHEKGGADEINVTGLSGVLADKQLSDWQVLAEVEVVSDCDYVDFVNLDINRDWFYILQTVIKNYQLSADYFIFINGDTTLANYYSQALTATGSSVSANNYNFPAWSYCVTEKQCFVTGFISKEPGGHFVYETIDMRRLDTELQNWLWTGNRTSPVSNITSIRIAANKSGAIGAGSRFILARPRS